MSGEPASRSPRRTEALLAVALALPFLARAAEWLLRPPAELFVELRLMPLFVRLAGGDPYALPGDGPAYVPLYTPLSFLAYLPAALFATPDAAIRAATLLAILFAAVAVLTVVRAGAPRAPWSRTAVVAAAALLYFAVSPTQESLFFAHADAPAILLAASGLALLARARETGRATRGAAALLALAPWAKQTFAPVVLVPVALALLAGRFRDAAREAGWAAALQVLCAGAASASFDLGHVWFWTSVFPARHPWAGGGDLLPALVRSDRLLLEVALFPLVLLVLDALRDRADSPALPFLAAGVLLVPGALAGMVKHGAAPNTLLPVSALLVLGVSAAAARASDEAPRARTAVALAGLLLAVPALALAALGFRSAEPPLAAARSAYASERRAPGAFWFPRNPLATYLGSGAFRHSETGLEEIALAGERLSPEAIRRHRPSPLRAVACPGECAASLATMPRPSGPFAHPSLPGLVVWVPAAD